MLKVKSIIISRPGDSISFNMGEEIIIGEKEKDYRENVSSIEIGIFRKVIVKFSKGTVLVYVGYPVTYELYGK